MPASQARTSCAACAEARLEKHLDQHVRHRLGVPSERVNLVIRHGATFLAEHVAAFSNGQTPAGRLLRLDRFELPSTHRLPDSCLRAAFERAPLEVERRPPLSMPLRVCGL